MGISPIIGSAVNLFKGSYRLVRDTAQRTVNLRQDIMFRARSEVTSNWGLARLSNLYGEKIEGLQGAIEKTLAYRIHGIKFSKDSFDRFNTGTLVLSLEMAVIIPIKDPKSPFLDYNAGLIHNLVSERLKGKEDKKGFGDRLVKAFEYLSNPPFGSKKIGISLIDGPKLSGPVAATDNIVDLPSFVRPQPTTPVSIGIAEGTYNPRKPYLINSQDHLKGLLDYAESIGKIGRRKFVYDSKTQNIVLGWNRGEEERAITAELLRLTGHEVRPSNSLQNDAVQHISKGSIYKGAIEVEFDKEQNKFIIEVQNFTKYGETESKVNDRLLFIQHLHNLLGDLASNVLFR